LLLINFRLLDVTLGSLTFHSLERLRRRQVLRQVEHPRVVIVLPLVIETVFLRVEKVDEVQTFCIVQEFLSRLDKPWLLDVYTLLFDAGVSNTPSDRLVLVTAYRWLESGCVLRRQEATFFAEALILAVLLLRYTYVRIRQG